MADVKDCCKDENNLKQEDTGREGLTMKRCQVCQCRHFKLKAEPGRLGAIFKPLGAR